MTRKDSRLQFSLSGNNAVGVGMASEYYTTIKECFQDLIGDVDQLAREPKLIINGKELHVELLIGGDSNVNYISCFFFAKSLFLTLKFRFQERF